MMKRQGQQKLQKMDKLSDKTDPGSTDKERQVKKKGRKAIGDYTYHEDHIIGWGYTSKVYRGRTLDKKNPLTVAIKKIPITDLDNLHISLLQNEVRIVKKLSHPNVVMVHDILYTKKNCYIVMELCEGGCLEKHMQQIESTEEKVKIISDICSAFQYLVSVGVVHRDIKPGNILRTKTGHWKLADFGFATDIAQALKDDRISVGTPIYMAPESLSVRKYSYKSDIFSLAVVFHQIMKRGKLLWFQKTKNKILESIMSYDMSEIDVPKPFNRNFLIKMLETNPQKRISSQKVIPSNIFHGDSTNYDKPAKQTKESSPISYEHLLRNDEIIDLHLLVGYILKEEKTWSIGEMRLELYSALKIEKEALDIELDSYSAMKGWNPNNRGDHRSNKYSTSQFTDPYSIEFITYLRDLIEKAISKLQEESSQDRLDVRGSDNTKLCYKKANGKYILSPFSYGSPLQKPGSDLRQNMLACKYHLQTMIIGHGKYGLGSIPDLRKVVSQQCIKPQQVSSTRRTF